jgi:predicted esterase
MLRTLETGASLDEAKLVAVMIHGRGGRPEDLADIGATLALDGVRYVCPEAPGNSWYPGRFMEPLENNQPALGEALAAIASLIEALGAKGFADHRIVLCGFSQGACLAAQTLLRRPAGYAAAILFTGGLIGPAGTVWRMPARIPGTPVLLTGSETDEWVPADRVRETAAVLTAFGAAVETVIYEDRPHIVSDDEIFRARALLLSRLAAAS